MQLEITSTLTRARIPWQELDGQVVLLNPGRHRAHELNETASWIWRQLESPMKVAQIMDSFCAEFAVEPELLKQDLWPFLNSLQDEGLIECLNN